MLSGLSAVVAYDGERGNNMIREFDKGLTVTIQRPIRDLLERLPRFQVCEQLHQQMHDIFCA